MSLELVLTGLGYNVNAALLEQVKRVLSACDLDENDINHIINLHEKIKPNEGFIALSSSEDVFKIKCESRSAEILSEFKESILEWAKRYKMAIKKVPNKNTYYILRREK